MHKVKGMINIDVIIEDMFPCSLKDVFGETGLSFTSNQH